MFNLDPRLTSGGIQDDIDALVDIQLGEDGVNELVSSLVMKYIQQYFGTSNPLEGLNLLEKKMEETGLSALSPISESYTLQCLGSITQTSAIMKEIIFNDNYQTDKEFRSCDVGSGTGILSLGAYISGLRKGLEKGKLHLVDHEPISLRKSAEVLKAIVGPSFDIHVILGNILEQSELEQIGKEKIDFWISETIGYQTPYFEVDFENGRLLLTEEGIQSYSMSREIDPFPEVLASIILKQNPNIQQDVKEGRVALFPDYINGLYVPGDKDSILDLQTSGEGPLSLGHIGGEFSYLRAFDANKRWM